MSEKTDALVLRLVEWSETSLIVTLLTRDFGKTSAVAKGARRPKSSFEGALDLLAVCRVVIIPKSGDTLDLLTEAKLERRFRAGSRDLGRLYAGYYVAELLRELTDNHDPSPELYDLAVEMLANLNGDMDVRACLLRFELQMLRLLGHAPSLESCSGCGVPLVMPLAAGGQVMEGRIAGSELAGSKLAGQNSGGAVGWGTKKTQVAFGLESGGILCANCRPTARGVVVIDAASRDWMVSSMRPQTEQDQMLELPPTSYGEIRGLLNRFIAELCGGSLRLPPYLAGMR